MIPICQPKIQGLLPPMILNLKGEYPVVEVFKTNVQDEKQGQKMISLIRKFDSQSKVNFDLDDCDRILRVESNRLKAVRVIHILAKEGFECEELE